MTYNPTLALQTTELGALVTMAAATAAVNSADQTNPMRGLIVGVNITALAGTSPTLTVTIQGKDPTSGTYYTVLASAALAATGFTELIVYPGATASSNVAVSRPLPSQWRIITAIGGSATPTVTATICATLIP